ncbi:MAG: hypothetical protein KGP33_01680 [Betaproteobacteria bacterium]|jgi:hypothetical protein|nr:hypothetical protein [Betaproteobacteria bacterium]
MNRDSRGLSTIESRGHKGRLTLAFLMTTALAGCAITPGAPWSHPQQSADRFEEERLFCETVARSQVIRPEAPPPAVNFTGLATIFKMMSDSNSNREFEAEVLRQTQECLKKKGWKPPA